MAGVGRERGRHPVHPDVDAPEIVDHGVEVPQGDREMRVGPPAAGVVRGQAALAEDLDGETQPHERPASPARRRSKSSGGTLRPMARSRP